MKDGIGKGMTRDDHPRIASQLFAAYSYVKNVRSLASVIGEEELSELDKIYLKFGDEFEKHFVNQDFHENREIEKTLEIGWKIISILPKDELYRVKEEDIKKYYKKGE
jgi:V/A-type H+-transporting ATPase subunit B